MLLQQLTMLACGIRVGMGAECTELRSDAGKTDQHAFVICMIPCIVSHRATH